MQIQTKFNLLDVVYIGDSARNSGKLIGGPVNEVMVKAGGGFGTTPRIFYAISNNVVISPAGGYYEELELLSESEAKEAAAKYHEIRSAYHSTRKTKLEN